MGAGWVYGLKKKMVHSWCGLNKVCMDSCHLRWNYRRLLTVLEWLHEWFLWGLYFRCCRLLLLRRGYLWGDVSSLQNWKLHARLFYRTRIPLLLTAVSRIVALLCCNFSAGFAWTLSVADARSVVFVNLLHFLIIRKLTAPYSWSIWTLSFVSNSNAIKRRNLRDRLGASLLFLPLCFPASIDRVCNPRLFVVIRSFSANHFSWYLNQFWRASYVLKNNVKNGI